MLRTNKWDEFDSVFTHHSEYVLLILKSQVNENSILHQEKRIEWGDGAGENDAADDDVNDQFNDDTGDNIDTSAATSCDAVSAAGFAFLGPNSSSQCWSMNGSTS